MAHPAESAPSSDVVRPPDDENGQSAVAAIAYHYSCRKCRKVLFCDSEIVPHDPSRNSSGNKPFRGNGKRYADTRPDDAGEIVCSSYFLDPDASPWVAEASRELHRGSGTGTAAASAVVVDPDTIYCPHCTAKVGSQHWVGSQCSCGAWITPAFKIHAKAVDKLPSVPGR